jgi:hypothetical protein
MEERTVKLHEIKAYSPRFLAKSWQELPRELKVVLENTAKVDALDNSKTIGRATPKVEGQKFGRQAADARLNVHEVGNRLNYDDAYPKGVTQPTGKKPTLSESGETGDASISVNDDEAEARGVPYQQRSSGSGSPRLINQSNVEQGHYGSAGRASHVVETNTDFDAPDDYEGQTEDEKKEQFKHEAKKPQTTDKSMQEQLWEEWLSKDGSGNMGDGGAPAQTSMTTGTTGVYNAVYGKDGRIKGQEKDKEEDTEKDKEEKDDKDKKERKG